MDINPGHTMTISEFYKDKNIFITGATGFLGKVLLDKLLRSCPDIGKIYILVRPKKGKDVKERVQHMLEDLLFDTLKQTNPSQLSKLIPLKGDCAELNLGLSEADYGTITFSVSVIYHNAATVRFDDTLKYAIIVNTRGTREAALLALQTRGLSVFVHVSTAFCNCVVGEDIKEQMYPAPDDWKKAIKIAEEFDSNQLALLTDKYIGPYPNTYTFSKALGEHVVQDLCEGKVPTVICRPSIVVSTLKDPVVGWIDNLNGPYGLLVAAGKGLHRKGYINPDIKINYIPCDVSTKAIIAASWDLGLRQQQEQVEIIHCSYANYHWMTFGTLVSTLTTLSREIPFNNSIWVPKGGPTRCVYYAYLCTILFHLVPSCFLDLGLKLSGKKPMLMKLQTKIFNAGLQLRYFSWQNWNFCNKNMMAIEKKILVADKETWGHDCRIENVTEYVKGCILGLRRYLLHEPDETLSNARIHRNRMYWLDKLTMFILYGSIFWFFLYLGVMETIGNKAYNSVSYYFDGENI